MLRSVSKFGKIKKKSCRLIENFFAYEFFVLNFKRAPKEFLEKKKEIGRFLLPAPPYYAIKLKSPLFDGCI
jgi:hypothetical protein